MAVTMKNNAKRGNILYLVVPCYNEEEGLKHSAEMLREKMRRLIREGKISAKSKIMLVNDGSKDGTWKIIVDLCKEDSMFAGICFSRNYGHQSAILSGMLEARSLADMVVTIDADLQQDIEALDAFIECYQNGSEIVYGVRNDRNTDGLFKRMTAGCFYKLMSLLGCNVMSNHADYRLLSRAALDALAEHKEVNLFLRGLIPAMGFPSDIVYFDVKEREAGESKYTLKKMVTLAIDGITSMSTRPIRLITLLGFLVCLFSFVMIVVCIAEWMLGQNVPGYTTSLVISLLMGGLTIFSLGIVGEYVGKIYLETKARPRYIIEAMILRDTKGQEDTKKDSVGKAYAAVPESERELENNRNGE